MRKIITTAAFLLALSSLEVTAQQNAGWAMVKGKIATPWAEKVDPANTHPEYPRPHLVRDKWTNLNGLWSYAIEPKSSETKPASFQGKILVPFAVESALSGVGKTVGKDSVLWYQRTITIASKSKTDKVLLHFGAVDWECEVYVNGKKQVHIRVVMMPFHLILPPCS